MKRLHRCVIFYSAKILSRFGLYVMVQVRGKICHGPVANVLFFTRRKGAVSYAFMRNLKPG